VEDLVVAVAISVVVVIVVSCFGCKTTNLTRRKMLEAKTSFEAFSHSHFFSISKVQTSKNRSKKRKFVFLVD
jgi:hypothetical protein